MAQLRSMPARDHSGDRSFLLPLDLLPRAERVLFEIATIGPGFTVDEPIESLGEKTLPTPAFEHLRDKSSRSSRPITNPRDAARH